MIYADLQNTSAREQWEERFAGEYIQPVLTVSKPVMLMCVTLTYLSSPAQGLDRHLGNAMQLILDEREGECL